jgi:transcriptional regulator with XRE-family HTH domain
MASPLLLQIKDRTAAFLNNTGLSQAQLCRYLAIDHSSLSQFLSGTKGLDPSVIIKLCQTLSLSHAEVVTKFSAPVRSSKILNLQESTQGAPARMRLDNSGWCPSEGNTGGGVDPYDPNGNDITNTPSADTAGPPWDQDLIDVLREARSYHKLAYKAIGAYIAKAKANAGITVPTGVTQKFSRRS